MDKHPSLMDEISQVDWEKTPESVRQLLVKLLGRIEQLERQYEALKEENQLLKEQLKQNSKNSSKPPSQDIGKGFKAKEKAKKGRSEKKAGGQPGHEGHERELYPPEDARVSKSITRIAVLRVEQD